MQAAAARLLKAGQGMEVGDALLDQRVIAGVGNALRNEICFVARIDPWRQVADLEPGEAERLVHESRRVMRQSIAKGRRPRSIYRTAGRACPRCGAAIRSRGQGDANRTAYWCPGCQS
jgi:endonuclease VIII